MLLVMTVLAVAWFWRTWTAPTTHTVGNGADSYSVIWFLAWLPYALGHGLNPLLTYYANAPQGINLMWTPVMPLVALVVSPITVTAGPVVAYNVIATAALALAGWAAYLAFRRWTPPTPAFLGALVFAFSPFMAAQSSQHVYLTFAVTAPLLLIVLDRLLVVQSRPAWRDGVLLGLLVWAQLLIAEEVLAVEVFIGAVTVTVVALLNRRAIRSKLRHAAQGVAVAAGVAGILSVWPLAVQFFAPQQPGDVYYSPSLYSADLWNFVSPTIKNAVHTASALSLEEHFTANWTEWGSYLGMPLIAFLIGVLVICRHRRVAWVAATITVSSALVSLGPSLHVAGRDSGIPLPWDLVAGWPVLSDLLPIRAAGIMFLGAGLMLALGLDELRHRAPAWRGCGYGLAVFGLAALAPSAPYASNPLPTDTSIAAGNACPTRPGASIFLLPSNEEYSLLWQAQAGFCFAVPTRQDLHALYDVPTLALDQASWAATGPGSMPDLTPSLRARAGRELVQLKVSEVVLGPTPPPAEPSAHARLAVWLTDLLGPPRHEGDLLVWPHARVSAGP